MDRGGGGGGGGGGDGGGGRAGCSYGDLVSTHTDWLRMWEKMLQYFCSYLHSDLLSKRYRLNNSVSR